MASDGPDQLRSWFMALCGCVISFTMSGVARATGILYVDIIKVYGVTRQEANVPFTIRNIIRKLAGPVVGIIGHKYGVRKVTVLGCVLAVLGVAFCSIAPNTVWISVLWGGVHGLGVALSNTLFPATVNQYFLKHRATASGLALSGTCVASFVFPFAMEKFLDVYGLSGTFLMTAALLLNVLPAAMLLKEPPWLKNAVVIPPSRKKSKSSTASDFAKTKVSGETPRRYSETIKSAVVNISGRCSFDVVPATEKKTENGGILNPCFSASTPSLVDSKEQVDDSSSTQNHCNGVHNGVTTEETKSNGEECSMKDSMLRVFRNPLFYLISLSFANYAMLFDPLMTILVDYIRDKGLDYNIAKYLITLMSIGDLFGRICLGWLTDRKYITLAMYMVIIQLVQGACFAMLPFFSAFEYLTCILVVYGAVSGTLFVIIPVLVSMYLPNQQSLALGCSNFVSGVVMFSVPPLIGFFRDYIGSYDGLFYITGGFSVTSALLWFFEPCLLRLNDENAHLIDDLSEES